MKTEIRNLSKSFDGKKIFCDFSYSFGDTGVYAIFGESGVGKTTLLRMLSGLDNDYEGEILGAGLGRVSYAFQEHRLFPTLTALQNVILPFSRIDRQRLQEKAKELLFFLGFTENELSLFPSELSGGMKQRISLARALLAEKEILLLDEPTKELDAALAEKVCLLIKEAGKNKLVIFVSHSISDIEKTDAALIKLEGCK